MIHVSRVADHDVLILFGPHLTGGPGPGIIPAFSHAACGGVQERVALAQAPADPVPLPCGA